MYDTSAKLTFGVGGKKYIWGTKSSRGRLKPIRGAKSRHVARIFERGGLPASEASKLWQGCWGAAPSGVKGRRPLRGVRGNILRNMASYTTFGNKDRVLNLLLT